MSYDTDSRVALPATGLLLGAQAFDTAKTAEEKRDAVEQMIRGAEDLHLPFEEDSYQAQRKTETSQGLKELSDTSRDIVGIVMKGVIAKTMLQRQELSKGNDSAYRKQIQDMIHNGINPVTGPDHFSAHLMVIRDATFGLAKRNGDMNTIVAGCELAMALVNCKDAHEDNYPFVYDEDESNKTEAFEIASLLHVKTFDRHREGRCTDKSLLMMANAVYDIVVTVKGQEKGQAAFGEMTTVQDMQLLNSIEMRERVEAGENFAAKQRHDHPNVFKHKIN